MSLSRKTAGGTVLLAGASGGTTVPIPTYTPIAPADAKTPSQLTMRVVHNERSRNPFPFDGPHTPFREEFLSPTDVTGRYTVFTQTDTAAPSSETIANGRLTLTAGASLSARTYRTHTKLLTACGDFVVARVPAGATGTTTQVQVGIGADAAGGAQIFAYYQPSNGQIGLFASGGYSYSGGSPTTPASLVTPTRDVWVAFVVDFPAVFVFWSFDGISWTLANNGTVSGTSLYGESTWANFRPFVGLRAEASQSISVSQVCAGYVGSVGFRDQKPVTHADGTPLRKDGRYWWTGTVAHGDGSFRSNSMAVYSFDPDTYQVELVRHLYYDLIGTGVGGGYGGQMVYDEATGTWHVLANSWGFDNQATGVDLIYATTGKDLLTPGSSLLKAARLTGLSSNSLYDCTLRRDGATWRVVAVETTDRTGWSTLPNPVLFTGSALTDLSRVTSDETVGVDGTCWAKIGGTWYVMAVDGSSVFYAWNTGLENRTTLTSWRSDAKVAALLHNGANFPPHAGTIAVDDEHRTRYCVLTYDNSTVNGLGASRGGLVVLEADEKPAGQEHQPKPNAWFGF